MASLLSRFSQVATGFVLMLCAPQTHAFCRTTTCDAKALNSSLCETDLNGCAARGIPLYWPQRCIPLAAHEFGSEILGRSAEELHSMVLNAAGVWMTASCLGLPPSMQFLDAGRVECGDVEYNPNGPNANIVIARDERWRHDFSAYAVTTVTFRSRTGEILNSDIELNSALIVDPFQAADLELVITHELGHALGLSHSPNPNAIMYAQYQADRQVTGLEQDDIEGICAVYTPGRNVPECDPLKDFDTRCGGNLVGSCEIGRSSPVRDPNVGLLAVLGVAIATLRRARRDRRSAPGRE